MPEAQPTVTVRSTVHKNVDLSPRDAQSSSQQQNQREISMRKALAACAFYGTCSISITFFNKAVFSIYRFHYPGILTLLQILVCLAAITVGRLLKWVSVPAIKFSVVPQAFPLAFCWWAYVVSGIVALRYLNIPMFSTLRKFTVLFVLLGETFILSKPSRPAIWTSVAVMIAGGLLAGATDLTMSPIGYVFVGICCISTALYLVLIIRVGKTTGLNSIGLLYYNNALALPMMLCFLGGFTNELRDVWKYPYLHDGAFLRFLLLSAAQATLLNIAIFYCTSINSPLATTVTGQIKDLLTVSVGLFVFGDVKISAPNLAGLGLSLTGSLVYSYVKFRTARASKDALKSSKSTLKS